jgi:hypothetical protein
MPFEMTGWPNRSLPSGPRFLHEKGTNPDLKCARYMPQRDYSRIASAKLQRADIGTIYTHPIGEFGLGQAGRCPQPPYIVAHDAPHVLRHGRQ